MALAPAHHPQALPLSLVRRMRTVRMLRSTCSRSRYSLSPLPPFASLPSRLSHLSYVPSPPLRLIFQIEKEGRGPDRETRERQTPKKDLIRTTASTKAIRWYEKSWEHKRILIFISDKQNEEMLLEKLLRQSKEERRLAARIVETRNKSKEIRRNRILREEQYAAQRYSAEH